MIPIKYRLDTVAEKEYIEKVLSCIKDVKSYSDKIEKLLEQMANDRCDIGTKLLSSKKFLSTHPNCFYLCIWLVMPYEELVQVKEYIDNMIKSDLDGLNMQVRKQLPKFKGIKNYHELKKRRSKIKNNSTMSSILFNDIKYDDLYLDFEEFSLFYEKFSKKKINNWIVEKTDMQVCPYCNILYTYNRGNSVTAQLDHFFPKSEYPLFALCFYNLIPSCSPCNKIKHDGLKDMVSPYKDRGFENLKITWNYKNNIEKEQYNKDSSLKSLEKMIEIKVITSEKDEEENIRSLKLEDAYQQHTDYAGEIITKIKTYTNEEAKALICSICTSVGITPEEIEQFYFSNYLRESELSKRPLAKMTRDFFEEYKNNKS